MTDQTQAGDQQDKLSLDQIIEMMRSQYLKGFGESVVAIRRYNVDWPDERVAMDGAAMFVACAFSGMQTFSPKLEGGDLLFNAFRVISHGYINSSKAPNSSTILVQALVMCAISILMEETDGGEFEDPRFAACAVIGECCKVLMASGKLTRKEILKMVGQTFGIMNDPLCRWEGKIKN